MKLTVFSTSVLVVVLIAAIGCGGHEGGVIDIPPGENPYQLTEQEQQAMNAAVDETEGLEQEMQAAEEASGGEPQEGEGAGEGDDAVPEQPQP